MKRILILYTSVGLGHKAIAENIGGHLTKAGYNVKLADILEVQKGPLVTSFVPFHQFLNKRLPFVWRWLYTSERFSDWTLPLRVKVAAKKYQKTKIFIDQFAPDLVIATQTTSAGIVEYLKSAGLYQGYFAIAFSDYHLHRYWLYDHADLYFVNIAEQRQQMMKLGIPQEKIIVCGITLKPRITIDADTVRKKFNILPSDQTILISSGSLGTRMSASWLAQLVKLLTKQTTGGKVKIIIVCGKNQTLFHKLRSTINNPNVTVLGYTSLDELYGIADIYLTKPGGLSVAESLQWRLPLLISHYLPGGEELNYQYLLEKRLIMPIKISVKPWQVARLVDEELSTHHFKQALVADQEIPSLIQENQEGRAVISAIKTMFHEV